MSAVNKYHRTVKIDAGDVVYDSNMPVRVLRQMASGDPNMEVLITSMAAFVVEWPFAGKPSNPDDWDDLGRLEFNALVRGVMEDLGQAGE